MKKSFFFLYTFTVILLLLFLEQGLAVSYPIKTTVKLGLFLVIPFFLFRKYGLSFLHLQRIQWNDWKIFLSIGAALVAIILLAFVGFRSLLDIDMLLFQLNQIGVTTTTFPFIAIYILFCNSLLEEFYFRGLLPSFFKKKWLRLLVPSFLFAFYHVAIFFNWFTWPLLLVAITGLWIGGFIFQLVNEKSKTVFPSWTIHIFADLGILLVGLYIFYIY